MYTFLHKPYMYYYNSYQFINIIITLPDFQYLYYNFF